MPEFKNSWGRVFKICERFVGVPNQRPILSSYKHIFGLLGLRRTRHSQVISVCMCVCMHARACVYVYIYMCWGGSYCEDTHGLKPHLLMSGSGAIIGSCHAITLSSCSSHFIFFTVLFFSCYQLVNFLIDYSLYQIKRSQLYRD